MPEIGTAQAGLVHCCRTQHGSWLEEAINEEQAKAPRTKSKKAISPVAAPLAEVVCDRSSLRALIADYGLPQGSAYTASGTYLQIVATTVSPFVSKRQPDELAKTIQELIPPRDLSPSHAVTAKMVCLLLADHPVPS